MANASSPARKTYYLVSYPRSGSTLLRNYFALLQGRAQRSVYADDVVPAPGTRLTHALDSIDLVKCHQQPSAKDDVIYLVRDGRNASLSFLYMKFLMGNHRYSALHEMGTALRYLDADEGSWAQHVALMLAVARTQRVVVMRYEDLFARPVLFLKRLLELMQTPVAPSLLEQCVALEKTSRTYAANPYNGYTYNPQPGSAYALIKRYRTGNYWQYIFDATCRRYFHEGGGTEHLMRFGYEASADWWRAPCGEPASPP